MGRYFNTRPPRFCEFDKPVNLHKLFLKNSIKITKKFLDRSEYCCYINGARVRYAQAYYAMKREIARKRGNFRGVCPVPKSTQSGG